MAALGDFFSRVGSQVTSKAINDAAEKAWTTYVKPRLVRARAELQWRRIPATLKAEERRRQVEAERQVKLAEQDRRSREEQQRTDRQNRALADALAADQRAAAVRAQAAADARRAASEAAATRVAEQSTARARQAAPTVTPGPRR